MVCWRKGVVVSGAPFWERGVEKGDVYGGGEGERRGSAYLVASDLLGHVVEGLDYS